MDSRGRHHRRPPLPACDQSRCDEGKRILDEKVIWRLVVRYAWVTEHGKLAPFCGVRALSSAGETAEIWSRTWLSAVNDGLGLDWGEIDLDAVDGEVIWRPTLVISA